MRCFQDTFRNYMFGLLLVCGRVGSHGALIALLCEVYHSSANTCLCVEDIAVMVYKLQQAKTLLAQGRGCCEKTDLVCVHKATLLAARPLMNRDVKCCK